MTNPDMKCEKPIDSVTFQQCQPGGVAEMFEIQRRRRIVSLHFENARFHLADLPACLQYRQRAFHPGKVEAY
mgnify:CR=1 FL=1